MHARSMLAHVLGRGVLWVVCQHVSPRAAGLRVFMGLMSLLQCGMWGGSDLFLKQFSSFLLIFEHPSPSGCCSLGSAWGCGTLEYRMLLPNRICCQSPAQPCDLGGDENSSPMFSPQPHGVAFGVRVWGWPVFPLIPHSCRAFKTHFQAFPAF